LAARKQLIGMLNRRDPSNWVTTFDAVALHHMQSIAANDE